MRRKTVAPRHVEGHQVLDASASARGPRRAPRARCGLRKKLTQGAHDGAHHDLLVFRLDGGRVLVLEEAEAQRQAPASLSRQSESISPWTAAWMMACCSSRTAGRRASCRKPSMASWTTLPAQRGRAESFFRRWISGPRWRRSRSRSSGAGRLRRCRGAKRTRRRDSPRAHRITVHWLGGPEAPSPLRRRLGRRSAVQTGTARPSAVKSTSRSRARSPVAWARPRP